MELETLINQLQPHIANGEDYTVTCNRVADIPLLIIKNNQDKIIEVINLGKMGN